MGWSFSSTPSRLKEEIRDRCSGWENKDKFGNVVSATNCITHKYVMQNPGSGILFKVMETKKFHPGGTVESERRWIGVDLMKCYKQKGGDMTWGYKDMDESCGPTALGCPLGYVNELTKDPIHNGPRCDKEAYGPNACKCKACHGCGDCWSLEFRERVREYWAARDRTRRILKSLQPGDKVYLRKGTTVGMDDHAILEKVRPLVLKSNGWRVSGLTVKMIDAERTLAEKTGVELA